MWIIAGKGCQKVLFNFMKMDLFQTKKHYEVKSVEFDRYIEGSRADQSISSLKNQSIILSSINQSIINQPQEINQVIEGFQ